MARPPTCSIPSTSKSPQSAAEPGDIVFTGSPAGSGASIGQFLKAGDRVRAEIDKVGCLEFEITSPRTRPRGYTEAFKA
jgi:hypothetical protein